MPPHRLAAPIIEAPRDVQFRLRGWIGERVARGEANWLIPLPPSNPGMVDMFARPIDLKAPNGPFAGTNDWRDPGPVPWAGEFAGKWLISAVQSLRLTGNAVLAHVINEVASGLLANQDLRDPQDPEYGSLGLGAVDWDVWNQYHVMLGLLRRFQQTGAPQLLAAVQRAADRMVGRYLGQPGRIAAEHPADTEKNQAIIHVLLLLYQETGVPQYLGLAQQIKDEWAGNYLAHAEAGQPFHTGTRTRWESLHNVQAIAELYFSTGTDSYRNDFQQIWASLRDLERHADGALGGGEGTTGDASTARYAETCATVAWMAVCIDMLRITGTSIAADELERSLFNAILGAQSPDGRAWTYHTPVAGAPVDPVDPQLLPQVFLGYRLPASYDLDWQERDRYPQLTCCSANGPRGLGCLAEWAVMTGADGITVNFYGPSTITVQAPDGTWVTIEQDTDYPLGGKIGIRLGLRVPSTFILRLRIPAWSASSALRVNGAPQACPAGAYCAIERVWLPGDQIDIELDVAVRFEPGSGRTAGKVAAHRGPLLLTCNGQFGTDPLRMPEIQLAQPVAVTVNDADAKVKATFGTSGPPMTLTDYASAWAFGAGRIAGRPNPGVPWQFTRSAWLVDRQDGDLLAARLMLNADGSVGGYTHPNERRWGFEGDVLTLYAANGAPSTRFTIRESRNGRQWLSGFSLLAPGIRQVLSEVDDGMAGKTWQFARRSADGTSSVIMPELATLPGGVFDRQTHPNEARWAHDQGSLVFTTADGTISTRFGPARMVKGRAEYSGRFSFDATITHVLTEIDPDVTAKLWRLWRREGTTETGLADKLHLLPGGRIDGNDHPNESRWGRDGDRLLVFDNTGVVTSTLDPQPCRDGEMSFAGPFRNTAITHRLVERAVGWPLGLGYVSWLDPAEHPGWHEHLRPRPPFG